MCCGPIEPAYQSPCPSDVPVAPAQRLRKIGVAAHESLGQTKIGRTERASAALETGFPLDVVLSPTVLLKSNPSYRFPRSSLGNNSAGHESGVPNVNAVLKYFFVVRSNTDG